MLFLVLLVCWVMTMFLWLLSLLGASPGIVTYSPWLAFFSCLLLGILVMVRKDWKMSA